MNKISTVAGIIVVSIICISAAVFGEEEKSSGGHPGSTGAPGEQTCAQAGCHTNAAMSDGAQVNSLLLGNSVIAYEPGQTYDMTVRINKPGIQRYGFEIVALDKDNQNIGSFTLSQTSRTQIVKETKITPPRFYVTHRSGGIAPVSPGVGEWKFRWTAPPGYSDSVKFYYVTNATNNDGTNQGDQLFFSKAVFGVKSTSPVADLSDNDDSGVFISPLPAEREISVNFNIATYAHVRITVYSAAGTKVLERDLGMPGIGSYTERFDLADFESGMYFVRINAGNSEHIRKFTVHR